MQIAALLIASGLAVAAQPEAQPASLPASLPTSLPASQPTSAPGLPTWSEFEQKHVMDCMLSPALRTQRVERRVRDQLYSLEGGRLTRLQPVRPRLVVGVLSAIKESDEETKVNLKRAYRAFARAKVDVIVANGDVALDEFDLEKVFDLLGGSELPVLVLPGNHESRAAFNRSFVAAEARHPNLFNMLWTRQATFGRFELLSMPGYYDRKFIPQSAGCHYKPEDFTDLGYLVEQLQSNGQIAVLVSHGPPQTRGKFGIDLAHDAGNVGDPAMAAFIDVHRVRFGLFGHILEAGGRGVTDLAMAKPAKPKKKHRTLYVNAGAASAMPWTMLGGRGARGLAMIVTFDPAGATYQVVKLR